jgi:perosamine synthetase
LFARNGGESFYAAWQLTYREPLMRRFRETHAVRQSYEPGLCPNAEYLQPRLIQLQTNHWDLDHAKHQAEILHQTAQEFGR